MSNVSSNKSTLFKPQITELRQYINHLDEQIARQKKQGPNTERLQDNKARALCTIEKLKQADSSNGLCMPEMILGA